MSTDARTYLASIRGKLRNDGPNGRRQWYASPAFPDELAGIARALKEAGVDNDLIRNLIGFGTEMMTNTRNMTAAEWAVVRTWDILERQGMGWTDSTDSFFVYLDGLMNRLVATEASDLKRRILREIDSDFATPVQALVEALPDEFAQSRRHLSDAVVSFQQGRKEESALFTRKAWESCVNFALSRLPSEKGLDSLTKKAEYVLGRLEMGDKSNSINRIKNLFEGRFLHVIDSGEKMPDPELPFYIALTTGFVHLVASSLVA